MPRLEKLIAEVQPAVCQVVLKDSNGNDLGSGSGFLTDRGLVSAHHVLAAPSYYEARIQWADDDLVLERTEVKSRITHESPENSWDYVLIQLDKGTYPDSYVTLRNVPFPPRGRKVLWMGFPFGTSSLTASIGYVSAVHGGGVEMMRIDGSVNRGNSGGPVFDTRSGELLGLITRAETGYLKRQFDDLVGTLTENIRALQAQQGGGRIVIGGLDPVQALLASQSALLQVAQAIERSANVGIGFATSLKHLMEHL